MIKIEVQKLLTVGGLEKYAKAIIAFLRSDLIYKPEVSLVNPNPQDFSPEYVFPRDMLLGSFSSENIPGESELSELLESAEYRFSAVAGMDESDMTRIMMFPVDEKTLAMRAICHFTDEEMAMSQNDRKKLERLRKKEAFTIIGKMVDEIASNVNA